MTTVSCVFLPSHIPSNLTQTKIIVALKKAMSEWNRTMAGLVEFKYGYGELQCRIFFDGTIDKQKYPTRVAECRDKKGPGNWDIVLDINTKWHTGGFFARFCSKKIPLITTLLHEIGHIMDLPHSTNPDDIMHGEFQSQTKISLKEMYKYRQFFIAREKNK